MVRILHVPCEWNVRKLVLFSLLPPVPSAAPTSVASTAANMSIFLTWQELPSEEQNGVILQYRVIVYMLAINETQQLETTETSLVLPDLHPFYLYELVVAGETSAGVGPYSHPVLQQLPEASEWCKPRYVALKFFLRHNNNKMLVMHQELASYIVNQGFI